MATRTIIIGDIHSCADEFFELLEKCEVTGDDTIIAAGDLFDRGPDPLRVYEYFRDGGKNLAIMGNHERKHVRRIFSPSQIMTRHVLGSRYDEVLEWMCGLPLYLDLPECLVVHAAYVPDLGLAEQDPAILVGHLGGAKKLSRIFPDSSWWEHHALDKPVVFGHEVQESVVLRSKEVYALDGGCAKGGWLHALILPDHRIVSVRARHDYWKGRWDAFTKELGEAAPKKTSKKRRIKDVFSWTSIRAEMDDRETTAERRVILDKYMQQVGRLVEEVAHGIVQESGRVFVGIPHDDRAQAIERVSAHPLKSLLLQSRFGKLTAEVILSKLPDPESLLAAARQLCCTETIPLSPDEMIICADHDD